jgi:hypothetical protein
LKVTAWTTPARAASAHNSRASVADDASGFSETMCLPCASAARMTEPCRWLGVVLWMTSTSRSAASASWLP